MGTRSLTYVYEDNTPIICMYRQYDGYMSGHGQELAEFLAPFTVVNGLGMGDNAGIANGMGCLAAQLVAHFKVGAGQFYLYPHFWPCQQHLPHWQTHQCLQPSAHHLPPFQ